MSAPKGRYVKIDPLNPEPLAICDYSKLPCMHKDLVRQMEWRGETLVWTGFLVNKRFADIPNEQAISPILPPDPEPVKNARPQFQQSMTCSNNPLPVIGQCKYYTIGSLGNLDGGVLTNIPSVTESDLQNYYWGSRG